MGGVDCRPCQKSGMTFAPLAQERQSRVTGTECESACAPRSSDHTAIARRSRLALNAAGQGDLVAVREPRLERVLHRGNHLRPGSRLDELEHDAPGRTSVIALDLTVRLGQRQVLERKSVVANEGVLLEWRQRSWLGARKIGAFVSRSLDEERRNCGGRFPAAV